MSSNSVGRPRHGLVAYSASKAALDESILGWRTEHPEHRFLRIVIGPTLGTDAARDYDLGLAADLFRQWTDHAFMTARHMDSADLGQLITEPLATSVSHPEIAVQDLRVEPPGAILTAADSTDGLVDGMARERGRGSSGAK